jgi:magnesium chelatase family protein
MALARLISRGQAGLDAYEVSVEVHLAGGLPGFTITGLPAPAVRESRDRVRSALQNSGLEVPASRITAHLGPADIPKQGGRFDLAIALGIVQALAQKSWRLDNIEFLGELSLGGQVRSVTGVVPAALAARAAGRRLVVPAANALEGSLVPGAELLAARHLLDVVNALDGGDPLPSIEPRRVAPADSPQTDLDEVKGHAGAKRALAVAAAGEHNLLMIGPPGSGKSMLASRLGSLLPALSDDELLSVASIASVAGNTAVLSNGRRRPFRSPHHTTRAAALIGGGASPRPGEISLAHHGVLFLDELPEFSRQALEAMREPLENGSVSISRLGHRIDYPARFQLVAAMNPCPCGYLGDGTDRCRCGPARISQYRSRISGPMLDRFDLHIEVPQVAYRELAGSLTGPVCSDLKLAVREARQRQRKRGTTNARLGERDVLAGVPVDRAASRLLTDAQDRWRLSARSVVRILRVARTLADLAGRDEPGVDELSEALHLRRLDRPSSGDTV